MSFAEYFTPLSGVRFPTPYSVISRFRQAAVDSQENFGAKPPRNPVIKPKNWTTELMPFQGEYVPCYVSRAEREQAVALLITGMSSTPVDWPDEVAILNEEGISVVSIGLLHTKDYRQYYNINRRLLDAFSFDERCSPAYKIGDVSLNRSIIAHSTAAPITLHNLSRDWAMDRKPESLKSAIYLNPFMDTYHSSKGHYPLSDKAFTAFSDSALVFSL